MTCMAGATTQDSLLSSTVTLLLNEALSTKKMLGAHEARLTALEQRSGHGSTSSPTPSSKWIPLDWESAAKALKVIATAIRLCIWFALHVAPWVSLIGAALWKGVRALF